MEDYLANLARARAAAAPGALPAPAAQPRLTAGGEGDASDGDEAGAGGAALPNDDIAIRAICARLATATDQARALRHARLAALRLCADLLIFALFAL